MHIRLESGAWVAEPEVDPEVWAAKAKRDAELREVVSAEELDKFEEGGGVLRLAYLARSAMADGQWSYPSSIEIPN